MLQTAKVFHLFYPLSPHKAPNGKGIKQEKAGQCLRKSRFFHTIKPLFLSDKAAFSIGINYFFSAFGKPH